VSRDVSEVARKMPKIKHVNGCVPRYYQTRYQNVTKSSVNLGSRNSKKGKKEKKGLHDELRTRITTLGREMT